MTEQEKKEIKEALERELVKEEIKLEFIRFQKRVLEIIKKHTSKKDEDILSNGEPIFYDAGIPSYDEWNYQPKPLHKNINRETKDDFILRHFGLWPDKKD